MRALFVFGSIALYIACAFVPPSEANLRAFAEDVSRIRSLNAEILLKRTKEAKDLVVLPHALREYIPVHSL